MNKQFSEDTGSWTLEWCSMGDQKGLFHIDTIRSLCRKNMGVFLEQGTARYTTPWIMLGVFDTIMEASDLAKILRDMQDEKPIGWKEDDTRIFIPVTEDAEDVQRLKKMPYPAYLQTSHWQTIKEYAKEYAQHRCQVCNSAGLIDVHHRSYENRGEEHYSDVFVLCRSCHELFHKFGKLSTV